MGSRSGREGADQAVYNGTASPPPPAPLQAAIDCIANSDFAKTDDGKAILQKIRDALANNKIESQDLKPGLFGTYNDGTGVITYSSFYNNDPGVIASELVHEGAHILYNSRLPKPALDNLDEEVYTNLQQLAFYDGQTGDCKPKSILVSGELDRRKALRDAGGSQFRDDVKVRYPAYN